MSNNLTQDQMDDIRAFLRAAIDVANHGMKQVMMNGDDKVGHVRMRVTGDVFRETADKVAKIVGAKLQWTDPVSTAKKPRRK